MNFDLDEIQSLNPKLIAEHKVKQAYELVGQPVFVEDTCLFIDELGNLPGPFIKFFITELGLKKICNLVAKNRNATAVSTVGYFDGKNLKIFVVESKGKIAKIPKGDGGFGWDSIYIQNGQKHTNAELSVQEYNNFYTSLKPFDKLRKYLTR